MKINFKNEYTDTPGGRFTREGRNSGEDFRETILYSKYMDSINNNEKLVIDMDGCYGFPSSFLEEAFGGLARKLNDNSIMKHIEIISRDEPGLSERISSYIKNALRK